MDDNGGASNSKPSIVSNKPKGEGGESLVQLEKSASTIKEIKWYWVGNMTRWANLCEGEQ